MTAANAEANPFLEEQLVICGINTLVGNERWRSVRWMPVGYARHRRSAPFGGVLGGCPEYSCRGADKASRIAVVDGYARQPGQGHFARLRLLDPDRYPDLEQFKQDRPIIRESLRLRINSVRMWF